jgi:hypothetical protein
VLGGIYFRGLTGRLQEVTGDGQVGSRCFHHRVDYLCLGSCWYHESNQVVIMRRSFESLKVQLAIWLPPVVKQIYVRTRQEQVDAGRCFRLQDPVAADSNMFELTISDFETYQWVRRELVWLKRVCNGVYAR